MGKPRKKANEEAQAAKVERIADLHKTADEHKHRAWRLNALAFIGGCMVVGSLSIGIQGVIENGEESVPPLISTTSVFALITAYSVVGGRNVRRRAERYEDQAFQLEVIERQTELIRQLPSLPAGADNDFVTNRLHTIVTEMLPHALREIGVEPQRPTNEEGPTH